MRALESWQEKEKNIFCAFLKKTWWLIALSSGLLLLIYSQWFKAPELHIDPDILVMNPNSTFAQGHVGRQGITFIHNLLHLRHFNPDFMSAFGWLSLCAAGVVIGYVLYRLGLRSAYACAVFGPLMLVSPIMAAQFYNYDRIISLGIGYALCATAVGMSYCGLIKKKRLLCLLSIPQMVLFLCVYQSFVFAYVELAILSFLLLYRRLTLMEDRGGVAFLPIVIKQALLFAVAYAINTVITRAFFLTDAEGMNDAVISWGKLSFADSVASICNYWKLALMGGLPYTTGIYGILSLLAILGALYECLQAKGKKERGLYVLAAIGLQALPLLLAVYCGAEPSVHVQFGYPLTMAGNILYLSGLQVKRIKRLPQVASALLAMILIWGQGKTVMRLIYTDQVRVEEDKQTIEEIATRVHQVDDAGKPVAFIGGYTNVLNPACLRMGYFSISVLGWDRTFPPHYVNGSNRTCQFFKTLGIDMQPYLDEAGTLQARKIAMDMPVWPHKGSVLNTEDCVIVKLSEDEWPEDFLQPALTNVVMKKPINAGNVNAVIESAETVDGNLVLRGMVWLDDNRYDLWKPHLYLFDNDTGELLEFTTAKYARNGLVLNGQPIANRSFMAMAPQDAMLGREDLSILFAYEDTGRGITSFCIPSVPSAMPLSLRSAGLPTSEEQSKRDLPTYNGFHYDCNIAAINENGEIVSLGNESGSVLYGPYSESISGTYDITLHYAVDAFEGEDAGVFDIALDTVQQCAVEIDPQKTEATLQGVKIEAGHQFEARVWVPKGMQIRIQAIEYERKGNESVAGLPIETNHKIDKPSLSGFSYHDAEINEQNELVSKGNEDAYILYGPYTDSVDGRYDITLHYAIDSYKESDTGTFDIALDEEEYAKASFSSENTSVTLEGVKIEAGHRFEARVWVPQGMVIRIQSIEYSRNKTD